MNPIIYAFLSIVLVATSQFLFKKGVTEIGKTDKPYNNKLWGLIYKYAKKSIIIGLALNGVAAFFWLLALSDLELSYIFPFLALNYIIIPVGASFLYNERLSRIRMLGIMVICVGVLFVAFS